jgi:preprotein translocase subunit YajC
MFPFESVAYAQSAGEESSQSAFFQFIPLVLILGVFWFLIIRPQQKKQKAHQLMVDSLNKGDKVVTNGGIFGTIVKVGEDRITLEIASKVQINIERQQVSRMDKISGVNKDEKEDDSKEKKVAKKDKKQDDSKEKK